MLNLFATKINKHFEKTTKSLIFILFLFRMIINVGSNVLILLLN